VLLTGEKCVLKRKNGLSKVAASFKLKAFAEKRIFKGEEKRGKQKFLPGSIDYSLLI